jgi:deazaflavin-dependent oxidoreductase (nitroreductase family)
MIGRTLLRVVMRMISGSSALYRLFITSISGFHLFVYRLTGGIVSGRLGLPTARFILLITRGRKTGKQRTIPLLSIADEGNLAVVASYGGLDQPPAWWLNLIANPEAHVRIGCKTIKVRAVEADDQLSSRLWPRFVKEYPGYMDYRNRTRRRIPIVILQSASNDSF